MSSLTELKKQKANILSKMDYELAIITNHYQPKVRELIRKMNDKKIAVRANHRPSLTDLAVKIRQKKANIKKDRQKRLLASKVKQIKNAIR